VRSLFSLRAASSRVQNFTSAPRGLHIPEVVRSLAPRSFRRLFCPQRTKCIIRAVMVSIRMCSRVHPEGERNAGKREDVQALRVCVEATVQQVPEAVRELEVPLSVLGYRAEVLRRQWPLSEATKTPTLPSILEIREDRWKSPALPFLGKRPDLPS
jgi:hypothetical protein